MRGVASAFLALASEVAPWLGAAVCTGGQEGSSCHVSEDGSTVRKTPQ